jgi:hypothetical protein
MTDKSKKLAELAALCEAATAPDREMDAVIHFVIKDGIGVGYASDAPAFTASLDAALTLVPEGDSWTLSRLGDGLFWCSTSFPDEADNFVCTAKTPAMALAGAALRARAAMNAEER